jgi:hypothetical protein
MSILNPIRCANSTMVTAGSSGIILLDTGNYPSFSDYLNQTYIWSASNWHNTSPSLVDPNGPLPGRTNHVMAYDGTNVMLYGGQTSSSQGGILFDTWIFNTGSKTWSQVGGVGHSLASPYGRQGAKAAYLSGTGALMFGGAVADGEMMVETWIWTGSAWNQIAVPNGVGPSARIGHCMAGSTSGTVLLFGGSGTNHQDNHTWTYTTAGGWVQQFPTTVPSVRSGACMCYDQGNSQWVMFGGSNEYHYLCELWVYSAGNWTKVNVPNGTGPAGNVGAQMAYDVGGSQIIMFGGISGHANYPSNATWALSGTGTNLIWTCLGGN